jgi:hypothetical protein
MKKLVFSTFALAMSLLACDSSSINGDYTYSDFSKKSYVSSEIINGKKPSIYFSDTKNTIEIRNFPDALDQTGKYQFLMPDESPSGKWTITKDSKVYFLIKSRSELVYRYYEGDRERSFSLKASK